MNKYNNPRLLNAVVSGTGMKHPIQPHVVVGDVSNGFIRGDLMDANAIVDLVNSGDAIDQETIRQAVADIIGTAPENLDTLGEVAETLTDMQDPTVEGSLANQISVINTTIEDNELTIAAALNDLNSRLLELVTRVDALDGSGAVKYLENEKYYLIGFNLPSGQYIAAQAIEDGSSWAMQASRVNEGDAYYLYNRRGEIIGSLPFESGQAMSVFDDANSASILAYNGQSVYFEPDYELELPTEYAIIP